MLARGARGGCPGERRKKRTDQQTWILHNPRKRRFVPNSATTERRGTVWGKIAGTERREVHRLLRHPAFPWGARPDTAARVLEAVAAGCTRPKDVDGPFTGSLSAPSVGSAFRSVSRLWELLYCDRSGGGWLGTANSRCSDRTPSAGTPPPQAAGGADGDRARDLPGSPEARAEGPELPRGLPARAENLTSPARPARVFILLQRTQGIGG